MSNVKEQHIKQHRYRSMHLTLKDVQSFLSVSNFYRQFITHYSKVARPFTDLTDKKALNSFYMTELIMKTFTTLKNAFIKLSLLKHFNFTVSHDEL